MYLQATLFIFRRRITRRALGDCTHSRDCTTCHPLSSKKRDFSAQIKIEGKSNKSPRIRKMKLWWQSAECMHRAQQGVLDIRGQCLQLGLVVTSPGHCCLQIPWISPSHSLWCSPFHPSYNDYHLDHLTAEAIEHSEAKSGTPRLHCQPVEEQGNT